MKKFTYGQLRELHSAATTALNEQPENTTLRHAVEKLTEGLIPAREDTIEHRRDWKTKRYLREGNRHVEPRGIRE